MRTRRRTTCCPVENGEERAKRGCNRDASEEQATQGEKKNALREGPDGKSDGWEAVATAKTFNRAFVKEDERRSPAKWGHPAPRLIMEYLAIYRTD